MIHIVTHLTSPTEVARLSYVRATLQRCIPDSRLYVINQTGNPIADTVEMDNIKHCGFGWTLRFLRLICLKPEDLLIKIDPDIDLRGNPLAGIDIPAGSCFGQIKLVKQFPVFLGGFQGYTAAAVQSYLGAEQWHANDTGPQDLIAYQIGANLGLQFITLPWCDLWAEVDNFDPNCKVIYWRSR